mgnify:FL=1
MTDFQTHKALVLALYKELEECDETTVEQVLNRYVSEDNQWCGMFPFNEQQGAVAVAKSFWQPLLHSWSFLQRRQDVFMAGLNHLGAEPWVVSMGHFMGLRDADWLGIPATGKMAFLRYAEFNCIENNRITKSALFFDIISVMNQAGIHPLPPQTGASFIHPGPRTHDGLLFDPQDADESQATLELINRMISDLAVLNKSGDDQCPPEYLARTWHEDMIWYGPAGIGASYTIPRYQEQHQYPFRTNLKNKKFNGHVCRLAEGSYGGFFGWPNLTNTPTGGFMGLPGSNVAADMRVVDIYRRAGDKLAENWVFIDLPYWLKQQGLDIIGRTRELVPTGTPS